MTWYGAIVGMILLIFINILVFIQISFWVPCRFPVGPMEIHLWVLVFVVVVIVGLS